MTRRYVFGALGFAAACLVFGQALALETLPGEPEIEDKVEAPPAKAVLSEAAGRVLAVDSTAGWITLEFRPMPRLMLEGGRRIFRVKDPASLKGVSPGDKVRFEVERNGRTYIVTRIVNSN